MYLEEYTAEELERLRVKLILAIYFEFCFKQKNQAMWEAGFEVYNKIGG